MKKTFKVVMLPIEKASNIQLISNKFLHLIKNFGVGLSEEDKLKGSTNTPQHLYVLSDDEIKEGDYGMGYAVGIKGVGAGHYIFKHDGSSKAKVSAIAQGAKKIVATTDRSLEIMMPNPAVWDVGIKTMSLPQPPESFIQAYIKAYNEGKPITEVDLEIEQHFGYYDTDYFETIKTRPNNTVIVHQSKMYTRDEVIELLEKLKPCNNLSESVVRNKWIQDNL